MRNRIKIQRATYNLTQAELAEKVKVSKWTISQLELNNYIPSAALAMRIAHTFGLTIEDMFEFKEENGIIEKLQPPEF